MQKKCISQCICQCISQVAVEAKQSQCRANASLCKPMQQLYANASLCQPTVTALECSLIQLLYRSLSSYLYLTSMTIRRKGSMLHLQPLTQQQKKSNDLMLLKTITLCATQEILCLLVVYAVEVQLYCAFVAIGRQRIFKVFQSC